MRGVLDHLAVDKAHPSQCRRLEGLMLVEGDRLTKRSLGAICRASRSTRLRAHPNFFELDRLQRE